MGDQFKAESVIGMGQNMQSEHSFRVQQLTGNRVGSMVAV